jgi:spore coat protein U-like protein
MLGARVPTRRHRRRFRRGSLAAVLTSMLGLALGATPGLAADNGTVDATVTVSTAAACIELSTGAVDFGTLALGAENQAGTPGITVTNCGDADATLLASGTEALGASGPWNLVDSAETCADTLGTDNYHLALENQGGMTTTTLSTMSKELGTLGAAGSVDHVARISTACPGSIGAGEIMSMSINYLATAIVAPPIVLVPLTADQTTADAAAAYLLPPTRDYDIPATCVGDPTIACPGGMPSNPLPQVRVNASNVQTSPSIPDTWTGSATVAVSTLQAIPVTYSGVSCSATVDSANGASPTVAGTFTLSFLSYPTPGGTPNYIEVGNVHITGIESADVQLTGGLACDLLSTFSSVFIPLLQAQIESYVAGNLCGDGDPLLFIACPPLP